MKKHLCWIVLGALSVTQVGCGVEGELIPLIVAGATVTAAVAVTATEFQQLEAAKLDTQIKQLQLDGMRNGQHVTTYRTLSDAEVRQCASTGKIIINGTSCPVTLSR